ncbi:dimethyladenosine transferase 2, mitochondrial [Leptopilina heterotoma]|uniref:dimethyladenosine transferase 2, mitochondrial n=1 Tax=Leptopilina heterotoma TaxID=63436 RepID=UPI001CAA153D|nr:dimethyladenosine transferase 2, mitochondrial [Leptopilina heterotoma]
MLKLIKEQLTISSTMKNSIRCIAAKVNEENGGKELKNDKSIKFRSEKQKKMIPEEKKGGIFLEISNYLKSIKSEYLIEHLPKSFCRSVKNSQKIYLVNRKVAEKCAMLLKDELTKDSDMFIAEAGPGFGFLTENLLKMSIEKIYLYEPLKPLLIPNSLLRNIIKNNSDRLVLRECDLLEMWSMVFREAQGQTNLVEKMLHGTKTRKWKDKPYMTVIGTLSSENFIKQLIMDVLSQSGFTKRGRVIFYLLIEPLIWERYIALKNTSDYKSRSIMFQTMFNYEKIDEFSRKDFLPWPYVSNQRKQKKFKNIQNLTYDNLYLVRIEPKIDLFDRISHKEIFPFYYFLKHHFQKTHTRVIPALENWIPGCGPRLIMNNFNIFTEFQDLDVEQLLKLYKEFSSFPEFEECYFLNSSSSYYDSVEDAFHEMGFN